MINDGQITLTLGSILLMVAGAVVFWGVWFILHVVVFGTYRKVRERDMPRLVKYPLHIITPFAYLLGGITALVLGALFAPVLLLMHVLGDKDQGPRPSNDPPPNYVGVVGTDGEARKIAFYAPARVAEDIEWYGTVETLGPQRHVLQVADQFRFDEVVDHIIELGK